MALYFTANGQYLQSNSDVYSCDNGNGFTIVFPINRQTNTSVGVFRINPVGSTGTPAAMVRVNSFGRVQGDIYYDGTSYYVQTSTSSPLSASGGATGNRLVAVRWNGDPNTAMEIYVNQNPTTDGSAPTDTDEVLADYVVSTDPHTAGVGTRETVTGDGEIYVGAFFGGNNDCYIPFVGFWNDYLDDSSLEKLLREGYVPEFFPNNLEASVHCGTGSYDSVQGGNLTLNGSPTVVNNPYVKPFVDLGDNIVQLDSDENGIEDVNFPTPIYHPNIDVTSYRWLDQDDTQLSTSLAPTLSVNSSDDGIRPKFEITYDNGEVYAKSMRIRVKPPVDTFDNSSVQRAFFYNDPTNVSDQTVAENTELAISTWKREDFRDVWETEHSGDPNPLGQLAQRYILAYEVKSDTPSFGNNICYEDSGVNSYDHVGTTNPNWLMRTDGGTIITPGSSAYRWLLPDHIGVQEWFVEQFLEMHDNGYTVGSAAWTGPCFLDNFNFDFDNIRQHLSGGQSISGRYADDSSERFAVLDYLEYVYDKLGYLGGVGERRIGLWGNFIDIELSESTATLLTETEPYHAVLDGFMIENWAINWGGSYHSKEDWLSHVEIAKRALDLGLGFLGVSRTDGLDTNERRFTYATYLLIANDKAFVRYTHESEYSIHRIFAEDSWRFGNPVNDYYNETGDWYKRDYERGAYARVNPTTQSYELNTAPIITPVANQNFDENDTVNITNNATDDDGHNTFTWTIDTGLGDALPSGLSINPTTGTISGTIDPGTSGTYDVFVKATDILGGYGIEEITFTIGSVSNTAPTITDPGLQVNDEGDIVNLQLIGTDPELQTLTWTIESGSIPDGLAMSTGGLISGQITYTASDNSPYQATIRATDTGGLFDEITLNWNVNDAPSPQTIIFAQNVIINDGSPCVIFNPSNIRSCPPYARQGDVNNALTNLCATLNESGCIAVLPAGTPLSSFLLDGFSNNPPSYCEELTVIYDDGSAIYKSLNSATPNWSDMGIPSSFVEGLLNRVTTGIGEQVSLSVYSIPYGDENFFDSFLFTIPEGKSGLYALSISSGVLQMSSGYLNIDVEVNGNSVFDMREDGVQDYFHYIGGTTRLCVSFTGATMLYLNEGDEIRMFLFTSQGASPLFTGTPPPPEGSPLLNLIRVI